MVTRLISELSLHPSFGRSELKLISREGTDEEDNVSCK